MGLPGNQLRLNRPEAWPLSDEYWFTGLFCAAIPLVTAWGIGAYVDFSPFARDHINLRGAIPIATLLVVAGFCLQPVAVKVVNALSPPPPQGEVCKPLPQEKIPPKKINYTQAWVQYAVVIPMLAVGLLVAAILWGQSQGPGELAKLDSFGGFFREAWKHWPFPLAVVFISLWLLSCCSIRSWDWKGVAIGLLAPVPAILVLHALVCAIMLLFHQWVGYGEQGKWLAYVWGPPFVLGAFALTIVILIGMLGRQSGEGGREWWSRFGAWLGIYGFGWMLINVATVYGPLLGASLLDSDTTWKGVTSGWAGTTLAGLFAGKSGATGSRSSKGSTAMLKEVIAKVTPFIFILGLLVAISTVLHLLIAINSGLSWNDDVILLQENHWKLLFYAKPQVEVAVLAACIVSVSLLAWRVDINEFSLNAFYRSRLVRCYLGATRFQQGERKPQNFTGFDGADDLKLTELLICNDYRKDHKPLPGLFHKICIKLAEHFNPKDSKPEESKPEESKPLAGPLHIVNCALNLGGSSDLSLHTRHSAIFTLTPLTCGSTYRSRDLVTEQEMGYKATGLFGGVDGQPTLGQAIAVSGAAASPNMGYHTSPVVAFLLTLFNVRLGWWFPNPRQPGVDSPSPWFSLRYLLMELFGAANDKSSYLAISDGGHFENLAAYELVKRRCRVIIISDGECDPNLQFEGLGALIRMCEVDLKAKIEIDVRSIHPEAESSWSRNRCAVGRIKYGIDLDCTRPPDSLLIYLKASMTGHEDTAVLQYKSSHPSFPHETTSDQFYGEDQFESYRSLGRDIAARVFRPVAPEKEETPKPMAAKKDNEQWNFLDLAKQLEKICSPSLPNVGQFTLHATHLMELWSQLGGNQGLDSLDQELTAFWPKDPPARFRSEFYLCSQIIQLMENVYMDVNLEETWDHPDNQGWHTLFTNWSKSKALRETWKLTQKTYGLRFQYFCHRKLHLPQNKDTQDD